MAIALGPVVAAARDQAHAVAVALQAEAVAVVFDLVKPHRGGRDGVADRGQAELDFGRAELYRHSDRPPQRERQLDWP